MFKCLPGLGIRIQQWQERKSPNFLELYFRQGDIQGTMKIHTSSASDSAAIEKEQGTRQGKLQLQMGCPPPQDFSKDLWDMRESVVRRSYSGRRYSKCKGPGVGAVQKA